MSKKRVKMRDIFRNCTNFCTNMSICNKNTNYTLKPQRKCILEAIAAQKPKLIKLSSRFKNAPTNNNMNKVALLTGDCSNFHINEPSPWNTKWYSKKFNGPGLKYLIAIAIYSKTSVLQKNRAAWDQEMKALSISKHYYQSFQEMSQLKLIQDQEAT